MLAARGELEKRAVAGLYRVVVQVMGLCMRVFAEKAFSTCCSCGVSHGARHLLCRAYSCWDFIIQFDQLN